MTESDDHRDVHHREWLRRTASGGESDAVTPLEMTPEEMYRAAGWRDLGAKPTMTRERIDAEKDAMRAFWGEVFSLKDGRDLEIAKRTDWVMLELLNNPELTHIFTGTAKDFDTIHELQKIAYLAVQEAFTDGFITRFEETRETQ